MFELDLWDLNLIFFLILLIYKSHRITYKLNNVHVRLYSVWLIPRRLYIHKSQGPVVQSIANLTSSLVVKLLIVLVSSMSNSQVFLL